VSRPAAFITTSWDDGHPSDQWLADLLDRHGVPATFYVPRTDAMHGKPTLDPPALRRLAERFELGGHTLTHVELTTLDRGGAMAETAGCRAWLEDVTGGPVSVFCPPCGRFAEQHRAMIGEAGFRGFRTVELMSTDPPRRRRAELPAELPTTLQAFPHGPGAPLRNIVKRRRPGNLWRWLRTGGRGWVERVPALLDRVVARGGVFHLWGHSWELDEQRQWEALARALAAIASRADRARLVTNGQLVALSASGSGAGGARPAAEQGH